MKRTFALLIALLAALTLFTGCNDAGSTTDTTASPTTTAEPVTTEAPKTDLEIIKDGVANYTIVRGETANQAAVDAAVLVRNLFKDETGVAPDIGTDWVKRGTERNHESLEILIGQTDYEESVKALENVPYGDYIITRVDNKLVVNAWSEDGLNAAVTAFGKELMSNAETGSFTLPADVLMTGTSIKIANQIPTYAGGKVRTVYHSGNENQVLIIDETNPDEYAAYRKALEAAGFTFYTENNIVDNLFATYIKDDYVINAGYYPYEKATRIIIEPRTNLVPLESENKYEDKGVQSNFAMLGVSPSDAANGMSFVFQLVDGSYIIFDGGHNQERYAALLYKYLQDHAPDKNNITIAAWIITHAHGDHHGAYTKFANSYANKVNLEYLIVNFPSDEARILGGLGTEGSGGTNNINLAKKFKGAKVMKVHVGQEFFLRNARLEILYTLESYAPGVLSYFNTSSLICRVEIAGQVFNIMGDASNYGCDIAQKMYGDYLKADFQQVSHHGYTTGTSAYNGVTNFYSKGASPVVIWPVAEKEISGMLGRAYNAHIYDLPTTKEVFVAGTREVRLMLPYTVGTSGLDSILK